MEPADWVFLLIAFLLLLICCCCLRDDEPYDYDPARRAYAANPHDDPGWMGPGPMHILPHNRRRQWGH